MSEIIDINSILKDFYDISGIRISIHDTEYNEIYCYPKEPAAFCKCLQQNRQVKSICENNDRTAFEIVNRTGKVYVYKCHMGLYEAVAPLYNYGTLSGYLMMGQICDSGPNVKKEIAKKANEILKNSKNSQDIAQSVVAIDRKLINSYINVMTLLAEYITGTNRTLFDNTRLPHLIKDYINKNFASEITLKVLSKKFGCCNATLTNSFKKEFGKTIMNYLFEVRLLKSAEMIEKTRDSFKEISFYCGFSDQNYFSKSFTKYFGCSPSQYRKSRSSRLT